MSHYSDAEDSILAIDEEIGVRKRKTWDPDNKSITSEIKVFFFFNFLYVYIIYVYCILIFLPIYISIFITKNINCHCAIVQIS